MKRFSFFILLALLSCDSNRIYEYNEDFNQRAWLVENVPAFEFTIEDPSKSYNVYYNVRNTLDFPYSRLFVTYELLDSTQTELKKELVSSYLFDEKTGKPLGSTGLGDLYDHRFPLLVNYQFPGAGKYSIQLEQFNRQDTLAGVLSVGVRVEMSESAN
jgi:gliding motility-associated lipoprotein GldH